MASRSRNYCSWSGPGRTAGAALRRLLCLAVMSLLFTAGAQPPLKNAAPSADDLCRKVLEALYKKDFGALDALRINEQEYRSYIWPALPISKIAQWKKRYDYVWGSVDSKCALGLHELIKNYGGQKLTFVSRRFAREKVRYNDCQVYRDTRITVKDSAGAVRDVKLFGSIVEAGGCFKIMSYNLH